MALPAVSSRPLQLVATGPVLVRLEQEGTITSAWGVSDNNRKARFYRLTRAGRRQLKAETRDWEEATAILARFLFPNKETL